MSRRCGSSKPTSTPLNGLAMKQGKTRRKVIEGNADTMITQSTRQTPATYRQCGGWGETKKALWQDKPPSKPSRVPSAWRGGESRKGELKENTGAKGRETNIKTLPQATIVAGGGETKRRKPTRKWKGGKPTVASGGERLAGNV